MNTKGNRQRWIDLLRSGKFTQGTGALRRADGSRCCLGVACDAYMDSTGFGRWSIDPDNPDASPQFITINTFGEPQRFDSGVLPPVVREWLGLKSINGSYVNGSLTSDNDSNGKTFEEIADIVEHEPSLLINSERAPVAA